MVNDNQTTTMTDLLWERVRRTLQDAGVWRAWDSELVVLAKVKAYYDAVRHVRQAIDVQLETRVDAVNDVYYALLRAYVQADGWEEVFPDKLHIRLLKIPGLHWNEDLEDLAGARIRNADI